MKRPLKMMSRLLDAVQRSFRRARPGSVLIMVVTLLVLLALIGTAAMSTARLDRTSSAQNVANTQVDMLAEGVKQMVISQLVADLTEFKDTSSNESPRDYFNSTDSAISDPDQGNKGVRDALIASRLPERLMYQNAGTISEPLNGDPVWRSLSYPPFQNGYLVGPNDPRYRFDPPDELGNNDLPLSVANPGGYALPLYKPAFMPSFKTISGENFPALLPVFDNGQPKGLRGRAFLAADTDGDGIADALLFRLPISPIRGITYYGAIRVVDNAAAININTAGNANNEVANLAMRTGAPRVVSLAGVYPISVHLDGLLNAAEIPARNNQLYAGNAAANGPWNNAPPQIGAMIGDVQTAPGVFSQDVRTDSYFLTPGDALHNQLGRRLDNPGFYDTSGNRYGGGVRPFGIGGSMTLAYGFTLVNSSAHGSLLERILPQSLLTTSGNQWAWSPYAPSDYQAWFANNFDYGTGYDGLIRRAMITTFNPVSNSVFRHEVDPTLKGKYPSKTNINTAQFEELQTSFLDVMADLGPSAVTTSPLSPFDDDTAMTSPVVRSNPYLGMQFDPKTYQPTAVRHPVEMFRSPLRTLGGPSSAMLQPYEVMQLRAAIAAVNTLAMRNPSSTDVVIAAGVSLKKYNADPTTPLAVPSQYSAVVYGMKRRPFITEVFVSNNPEVQQIDPTAPPGAPAGLQNKSGFAAIELHNPYDDQIDLTGWSLKTVDRGAALTYTELGGGALGTTPYYFPANTVIPPHQYLVVWNYGGQNAADGDSAQYLPGDLQDNLNRITASAGSPNPVPTPVVCPTLHNMIGKELVLVRPASAGAPASAVEWAPVDSFDCTGLTHQVAVAGMPWPTAEDWHYVRANDPLAGKAWHFVYPGRYDATQQRRQQGTDSNAASAPWDPTKPDPWSLPGKPPTPSNFGFADAANSRDVGAPLGVCSFPIQIGNTDSTGHFKANGAAPGLAFPMGGFARAGDVMQVPYIGSYMIFEPPTAPPAGYTPTTFTEINSLTMDAAFAEDTDVDDDVDTRGYPEDIGRFAPALQDISAKFIHVTGTAEGGSANAISDVVRSEKNDYWNGCDLIVYNPNFNPALRIDPTNWRRQFRQVQTSTAAGVITVSNPFNMPLVAGVRYPYKIQTARYGHYAWASDLLDYFTAIHSPANDFLPNVDPYLTRVDPVKNIPDPSRMINRGYNASSPPGTPPTIVTNPPPVTEDDVPSEGLININTASWKVLGALPLVMGGPSGTDFTQVNTALSEQLAKRIVYFRDVDDGTNGPGGAPHPHGPFKSLTELCLIPEFVSAENTINVTNAPLANPGVDRGDYSLLTNSPLGDAVRLDFKEKYLNLTRISNLITLRSDCYTVYLQVQGWQDAGSANAKLMVQRRLAFIVDRSHVTPLNPSPAVYNVQVPPSGR